MVCHRDGLYSRCVLPGAWGGDPGVTGEADVDQTWLGVAAGTIVLVIAVVGVTAHYLRERRRADLLRNLEHHEWWQQTRSRR